MDDEIKRLETELAKVRLAKEKLELQRSLRKEVQREKLSAAADRVIDAGREVATQSIQVAERITPTEPISWSRIALAYFFACALFVVYIAGLPDSKNNILVFAFFGSCALAAFGSYLLLRKLLQLTLH